MKSGLLAALLATVLVSAAGAATVPMVPPSGQTPSAQTKVQPPAPPKVIGTSTKPSLPAQAKTSAQAKADCPCNCPQKSQRDTGARSSHARHHFAQRAMRRYTRSGSYHYAAAAPVHWHWGSPMTASGYEAEGLRIDDRGWTGGVGSAPDGGGGFVDGYGQVHFANGGDAQNGPTYNSYGQSSQFNPSQAGPFQPRLMGGFAPPSR